MSQSIKLVPTETEESSQESKRKQTLHMQDGETLELEIQQSQDGLSLHSDARPLPLTISMGADGPKVELSHASLKLKSTERVEIDAKHLELTGHQSCRVKTGGDAELLAEGELRIQSKRDCIVKGDVIHLN